MSGSRGVAVAVGGGVALGGGVAVKVGVGVGGQLPVAESLTRNLAPSPVPVKYALAQTAGFDCESVRLPLVELNAEEKAVVDKALATIAKSTA